MNYKAQTLRGFLGSKDFEESRNFYKELDFGEVVISKDMVLFKINQHQMFYLQDYYVKKWNDNCMMFLEVDDLDLCYRGIRAKNLDTKFKNVRITDIKTLDWGREFFMHDPSGILWHFGVFNT